MCGFDCPCDPKVCNGGCPGGCGGNWLGQPTDGQMLAYLEGQHGPPHPEALKIIQDELEQNVRGDQQ